MRWLRDLREAFFGGSTRAPRDYPSTRRWFGQRILPLIRHPLYAAFIAPLDRLGDSLERLSARELAVIEQAAQEVLGENFIRLEREISWSPEDGSQMESVTVHVREREPRKRGGCNAEDKIRERAITAMPSIYDNHLVLWLREPEPETVSS